MNEIQENGIKIYTGETDEDEDDNPDIKELKVSAGSVQLLGRDIAG